MKRWLVIFAAMLLLAAMAVTASATPIHVGGGPMLMSSPIHVGGGPMNALTKVGNGNAYGLMKNLGIQALSSPIHVGGGPTVMMMSAPIHVGGGPI